MGKEVKESNLINLIRIPIPNGDEFIAKIESHLAPETGQVSSTIFWWNNEVGEKYRHFILKADSPQKVSLFDKAMASLDIMPRSTQTIVLERQFRPEGKITIERLYFEKEIFKKMNQLYLIAVYDGEKSKVHSPLDKQGQVIYKSIIDEIHNIPKHV